MLGRGLSGVSAGPVGQPLQRPGKLGGVGL